jgi:hypothetical protein
VLLLAYWLAYVRVAGYLLPPLMASVPNRPTPTIAVALAASPSTWAKSWERVAMITINTTTHHRLVVALDG